MNRGSSFSSTIEPRSREMCSIGEQKRYLCWNVAPTQLTPLKTPLDRDGVESNWRQSGCQRKPEFGSALICFISDDI
jgi:hypothetical protein